MKNKLILFLLASCILLNGCNYYDEYNVKGGNPYTDYYPVSLTEYVNENFMNDTNEK